jgi:hypothetical protein
MSEDWVTVATFNMHAEATLAKSALEAAGIPCWLRDEHVGRMYGGIQSAVFGGIKLQVRPEDEAAALAALEGSDPLKPDMDSG